MRFVSRIALIVSLLTTPAAAQVRHGFWLNGAMGYGTLDCQDCNGGEGGFSGGLSLGGTLSPKWLLGVGTAGWVKSEGGLTRTVGTLDARVRFYPSRTGGFFLTGGMGVGDIRASGFGSTQGETGVGVLLGLGVDLRVGSELSLTPFLNGFTVSNDHTDADVGQIGLSLTWHKFASPTPSSPAEQRPEPTAAPTAGSSERIHAPEGTNFVGDIRLHVYYPIECAAEHAIPPDQQAFFRTTTGAEQDGFRRSGDC